MNIKSDANCKSSDVIYAARCKICNLLYIGETKDKISNRFSKHRYDTHKRPDNCDLAKHMSQENHDFDRDLDIFVLEGNFKSDEERKFQEDRYICLLGTLSPSGMNTKQEDYCKEMYGLHQSI